MRDTVDMTEALGMPGRIDRYIIKGLLGSGGMGSVYLGFDEKLSREVAIKVIRADGDDKDMLRARFHREVRAVAMLHHPGIVEVLDYSGPEAPELYMVLERLQGRPLDAIVETRPLTESEAAAIAYEIADALGHAHDKGIIHRDIKPENIFVEPDGRVVLTDFGIAKGTSQMSDATFVGTQTAVVGTPLFSSMEQLLRPKDVTSQSDLFSLGAVLYNIVSRDYAYPADTMKQLIEAFTRPPKPLVNVSDEFNALVAKLLASEPSSRPKHARDVQRALRPILERNKAFDLKAIMKKLLDSPKPLPRTVVGQSPVVKKRTPVWVWIAGVVAIAAAAFSIVFFGK